MTIEEKVAAICRIIENESSFAAMCGAAATCSEEVKSYIKKIIEG